MKNKLSNKELINIISANFYSLYKHSALLYGIKKYKNYFIASYYYYDLKNKTIIEINVVFKNIDLTKTDYLVFKFENKKLFSKNIKWKIITLKTFFKRMIKKIFLFNNYKFEAAYINNEIKNVKNIVKLYELHLDHIKKQFIAIEYAKKYKVSYKKIITNWKKFEEEN